MIEQFQIKVERFEKGVRLEMIHNNWIVATVLGPDEFAAANMFGSLVAMVLRGDPPREMSAQNRIQAIRIFADALLRD